MERAASTPRAKQLFISLPSPRDGPAMKEAIPNKGRGVPGRLRCVRGRGGTRWGVVQRTQPAQFNRDQKAAECKSNHANSVRITPWSVSAPRKASPTSPFFNSSCAPGIIAQRSRSSPPNKTLSRIDASRPAQFYSHGPPRLPVPPVHDGRRISSAACGRP